MPLLLVQNDITTMQVDAIVNAANESLLGGGGVDGAIHRAAGPELLAECRTLHGCKTGQAKLTGGYRLPAKFVIHTVGPIWRGGTHGEPELLASAYRSSLELALAHRCETVAFPLISSGAYGYPKDRALKVAVDTIGAFLLAHDMLVYLVIFDRATYTIGAELSAGIAAHLAGPGEPDLRSPAPGGPDKAPGQPGESFAQMLLRQIGQRGLTDAQCCRRANLDRGLRTQGRSGVHYRPSKSTALALAVALEHPLEETRELLQKAGFALSRASRLDAIVEYFIARGNYNIFEINAALFAFDQGLLGG